MPIFQPQFGGVKKLLRAIDEGNDIAIGSRAIDDFKILKYQPFYRALMGKTFNKIVWILGVKGFRDTPCDSKYFTRQAALEIFSDCRIDGFSFDAEAICIAKKKGFKIKEVGVLWRNDPQSKVHPVKHSLQMLRDIMLIRHYSIAGYYGRAGIMRVSTET